MKLYPLSTLALAFALLSHTALAQPMNNELETLLQNHPRMAAEAQNVAAAQAAIAQARSGYLPSLDTTAAVGYEDTNRKDLIPAGQHYDLDATSLSATLTQNLFHGFLTDSTVSAATSGLAQADATRESTRQQLLFEGSSAYIAVLRQVKLTELSKRNMATLQTQLNLEDERVSRGSGIAVDVLQAKSRLQIAKERYTAFTGGLDEAVARYTQVFGKAPQVEQMELPPLPEAQLPKTLESALQLAKEHHPTLAVTTAGIDALEAQKEAATANYYPSVDVVASSSYDDNVAGIRGTDVSNSLTLRGSWNLFSGFSDKARYSQAIAQHQSAMAVGEDTHRRVMEEVKLAWSNYNTSRERFELLENAVNIAEEVHDARKRLRDVGKDTALNVLDAENESFRAQIDAAAAEHDYYTAAYRLLLAVGMLDAPTQQTVAQNTLPSDTETASPAALPPTL